MSRTFVRRLAAGALVVPLLLGGCSDDEPEPDIPTASPSASVTETTAEPTEPAELDEPTLPPEAEGKGIKAAEAFVRYYIAMVDHSRRTMDVEDLRRLSAPTCVGCTGLADLLAKVAENGGLIEGGDQVIETVRAQELGLPGKSRAYRAAATVQTTEQTVTDSGVDGLDGIRPPEELRYGFVLLRNGSRWQVSEWDIL